MNISELLFQLCSAWSWPCCPGREPWFSPISARRFCTSENFFSEEAVCHLPLRSILHDMKLSTQAGRSAFTIRAFVSTIGGNDCCSRYISVPEALEKQRTHSHAEASSTEKWGNQKNSASIRNPSRIISPNAHLFYMMLPNVFKEVIETPLFLKSLLFSSWTISIGGFW